jgi:LemA protein
MLYVVIIFLAVLAFLILIYNSLVRLKLLAQEGWSGIDVQLKRRYNLIPNLVETVKGYTQHERGVLENVTKARAQTVSASNVKERGESENMLSQTLKNLFAVVENYPQLKANENFLSLQEELSKIEDNIQLARRYYNGTVRNLNIKIESFPSNVVASMFGFKQRDFFQIEEPQERKAPQAKF